MSCPRAALFDLDETLAPSFEPPASEMIARVLSLLERIPVAIVTGRDFGRIGDDFLARVSASAHVDRFFLLTEGAAQCFRWSGSAWREVYTESLSPLECERIKTAFKEAAAETGALEGLPVFGEQFVQKRAMMAFAALGIGVPRDLKYTWDPGNVRREKLFSAIKRALPDLEVLMGGATSIDVTRKGVDKAYGVRWLAEHLNIAPPDMLYVGDALYPGGNDYVVIETGIKTRPTSGPEETARILDELLVQCA